MEVEVTLKLEGLGVFWKLQGDLCGWRVVSTGAWPTGRLGGSAGARSAGPLGPC